MSVKSTVIASLVGAGLALGAVSASAQSVREAIVDQTNQTETTLQLQSEGRGNTQAVNEADVNAGKAKVSQTSQSRTTGQIQVDGMGNSQAVNKAKVGK